MCAFGENLRKIRIVKGITQDDVARMMDTTKQVVSNYENSHRIPKITIADAYAKALGVTLGDLVDAHADGFWDWYFFPGDTDARNPDAPRASPDPPPALSPSESELLALYRDLNAAGQDVLLNTARGLAHNPAMQKDGPSTATRPA